MTPQAAFASVIAWLLLNHVLSVDINHRSADSRPLSHAWSQSPGNSYSTAVAQPGILSNHATRTEGLSADADCRVSELSELKQKRHTFRIDRWTLASRADSLQLLVPAASHPFAAATEKLTQEQIRQTADRVMQQPDYRAVRRRVLENITSADAEANGQGFLGKTLSAMGTAIGDFVEWILSGLFSNRRPPQAATRPPVSDTSSGGSMDFNPGTFLLYLGLAALIGTAIWIIATVIRKSDGQRKRSSEGLFREADITGNLAVPPGDLAVSTYESRAIQMASEGNFRAAVRELLLGSMSWVERAGLIRFRKGLTNRDYIRAVWKQDDRRLAYIRTATEFERIFFGRREATREGFETCLTSFQGSFREEVTTTSAS